MIEVTQENFEEEFEKIKFDLAKCSFVAVDFEFSLLPSKAECGLSFFDNGDKRYNKLLSGLDGCTVLQAGFALFTYNNNLKHYDVQVYKFHICPKYFGPSRNEIIKLDSSSIEFLAQHSFDFNKVFGSGVTCMNCVEKSRILRDLANGTLFDLWDDNVNIEQQKWIELQSTLVAKWLNQDRSGEELTIDISGQSCFYTYVLHSEIRRRFPRVWTFKVKNKLIVKFVSAEERSGLEAQTKNFIVESELINDIRGFSKVFDLLVVAKKPIIGHNMYLDLLFAYKQFYDALPGSYAKYKTKVMELFPEIYDTKFISYQLRKHDWPLVIDNDSLSSLYASFETSNVIIGPKILVSGLRPGEVMEQKAHDAGWDAYATGYSFLKMMDMIPKNGHLNLVEAVDPVGAFHLKCAESFKNKVNITMASVSHVVLDGPDPTSSRPPFLFVARNDHSRLTLNQLDEAFNKYGLMSKKLISPYSALIATPNFSSYRDLTKDKVLRNDFRIEKYSFIKHNRFFKYVVVGVVLYFPVGLWLSTR